MISILTSLSSTKSGIKLLECNNKKSVGYLMLELIYTQW